MQMKGNHWEASISMKTRKKGEKNTQSRDASGGTPQGRQSAIEVLANDKQKQKQNETNRKLL